MTAVDPVFPERYFRRTNLIYHWRINNCDRITIRVVTRQLFIKIIICWSSVITTVVHCNKFKKIKRRIQVMVLEKMLKEFWQFKQLTRFGIPDKVYTNQYYRQFFTHSWHSNIQKWCHMKCNASHTIIIAEKPGIKSIIYEVKNKQVVVKDVFTWVIVHKVSDLYAF